MYLTPGHTEGSCCYYIKDEGVLMSGDTIFCENCGRCDLPGGNFAKMQESLDKIINHLPEDVKIYPGHGRRPASIMSDHIIPIYKKSRKEEPI